MNENFEKEFELKYGLLFVVSGPSGAGKSAICRSYVNRFPDTYLSVSETTRAPRKGEKEGREYFYISEEEFEERRNKDYYLECAGVYTKHYGTPKAPIIENLQNGHNVILEIDPQGAMQVKQTYPKVVLIYILPNSIKTLEDQIRGRKTETEEQIQLRLGKSKEEIKNISSYDYIIINKPGRITKSVSQLASIIGAEECKVKTILDQDKGEVI